MKEELRDKILKDHANGMILADIAKKYDVSANDLVNIIIENGVHEEKRIIPPVGNDSSNNTEVQEAGDTIVSVLPLPTVQESPVQHYMPTHNDVFMDLIVFGLSLDDVCFKYDINKGDVGIMLEEVYKEVTDKVVPIDDIKEAIKKICAEVYLARFN